VHAVQLAGALLARGGRDCERELRELLQQPFDQRSLPGTRLAGDDEDRQLGRAITD